MPITMLNIYSLCLSLKKNKMLQVSTAIIFLFCYNCRSTSRKLLNWTFWHYSPLPCWADRLYIIVLLPRQTWDKTFQLFVFLGQGERTTAFHHWSAATSGLRYTVYLWFRLFKVPNANNDVTALHLVGNPESLWLPPVPEPPHQNHVMLSCPANGPALNLPPAITPGRWSLIWI